MPRKHVLNVGQCHADGSSMTRVIEEQFEADVVPADTAAEARALLERESFHLILVNRILDADGSSGLELIKQIKADPGLQDVPVMLVSNYEDWQQEAAKLGAVPGFGKAGLR